MPPILPHHIESHRIAAGHAAARTRGAPAHGAHERPHLQAGAAAQAARCATKPAPLYPFPSLPRAPCRSQRAGHRPPGPWTTQDYSTAASSKWRSAKSLSASYVVFWEEPRGTHTRDQCWLRPPRAFWGEAARLCEASIIGAPSSVQATRTPRAPSAGSRSPCARCATEPRHPQARNAPARFSAGHTRTRSRCQKLLGCPMLEHMPHVA